MSQGFVSVVMIFYNSGKYIEEAIKSVLNQTYQNFELILVDDGSTDGSKSIAESYCKNTPEKVRMVWHDQNQNRGMSASRNLGIENSKGDYIAFLDSDDVWLSDKLSLHMPALVKAGADGLFSPSIYWFSWDNGLKHADKIRPTFPGDGTAIEGSVVFIEWLKGNIPCPHLASLLLKKDFLLRVGLFEAEFKGMFEDQVFMMKLLSGKDALVFPATEPKDLYRQHSESCVATSRKNGNFLMRRKNQSQDRFVDWMVRFSKLNIEDKKMLDAVDFYVARYNSLRRPHYSKITGLVQHYGKKVKSLVTRK